MRAAAFLPVLALVAGCDDSNPVSAISPSADGPLLAGERIASPVAPSRTLPEVVISQGCGRILGNDLHVFLVDVRHEHYARSRLEYRVRLLAHSSCEGSPSWTPWVSVPEFTEGPFPVPVAIDRLPPGCGATFTLQVRTPRGVTSEVSCEIMRL